jgi:hypothetical protein
VFVGHHWLSFARAEIGGVYQSVPADASLAGRSGGRKEARIGSNYRFERKIF